MQCSHSGIQAADFLFSLLCFWLCRPLLQAQAGGLDGLGAILQSENLEVYNIEVI